MLLETLIVLLLFVNFGLLSDTIVDWIFMCSINTSYYNITFATMILDVQAMLLEGAGVVNWLYSHLYVPQLSLLPKKKFTFIQSLLLHSMLQNTSTYLICYFS